MNNLFVILVLISFISSVVYGIKAIRSLIKADKSYAKRMAKFSGIAFGALVASFVGLAITTDPIEENNKEKVAVSSNNVVEETEEERVKRKAEEAKEKATQEADAKAKKEAEAKAKVEADAKAKSDAEAKAKSEAEAKAKAEAEAKAKAEEEKRVKFEATGMFEVGKEIKPGLYRNEDGVSYYARLSGFGGGLDEILSNGNASGPTLINILDSDVGFETTGSGYWYLIDASYKGEKLTTFSDGIYLVGQDISPGKYKSDGVSGYYARLSGFTGELDEILSNNNASGPAIIEILPTDKGFQTSGGITWTKSE